MPLMGASSSLLVAVEYLNLMPITRQSLRWPRLACMSEFSALNGRNVYFAVLDYPAGAVNLPRSARWCFVRTLLMGALKWVSLTLLEYIQIYIFWIYILDTFFCWLDIRILLQYSITYYSHRIICWFIYSSVYIVWYYFVFFSYCISYFDRPNSIISIACV